MLEPTLIDSALKGKVVAVPEARQLDVFCGLLERRGATVLRRPLVAIKDAPDPQPVLAWLEKFNAGNCSELILLTGEGLRRLLSCLDQHRPEWKPAFLQRLAEVRTITRGPKPARVLRELGLQPTFSAAAPTTAGVIETLRGIDLRGHTVGVQLYGAEPNLPLIDYLRSAGVQPLIVAPYIYADAVDDAQVRDLIARMADGAVDIIAFTSMAQINRLFAVGELQSLKAAFARVQVAAVGPVVRDALAQHGVMANCMPEDSFFMKPLVTVMGELADSKISGEGEAAQP
ncbi:MAG: uroporphyrinogen-III synthase [Steroidobacteraceae bacterium]